MSLWFSLVCTVDIHTSGEQPPARIYVLYVAQNDLGPFYEPEPIRVV